MDVLRWSHDWGSQREHWDKIMEMGRPVPEPFLNQPEILPEFEWYWDAFCDLMTERSIGMGIGPIPISSALAYAERLELNDREWQLFWSIIREVDSQHILLLNKTTKTDIGGPKNQVSMQDTAGMKAKMEGLKEKMKDRR